MIGGSVGALSDWIGLDGVGEECATAAPIQMGSQAPNAITRQQGMGTGDVAARHG
jgi:hypothetical protein